jgi:hypothetical protein
LVSISLLSALIFIISLLLLVLHLACSYFSRSLRCSIRLFIWDGSLFLIYALMAINFHLWTAFAVSHRFGRLHFHFLEFQELLFSCLTSSVTHWSWSNVFFSL